MFFMCEVSVLGKLDSCRFQNNKCITRAPWMGDDVLDKFTIWNEKVKAEIYSRKSDSN